MTRQLGFSLLSILAIMTSSTQAATLAAGSIGFTATDFTVDGSDTGDITTGTVYTFATGAYGPNTQITTTPVTGIFSAVPLGTSIVSTNLNLGAGGGTGDPYLTLSLDGNSFIATTFVASFVPPLGQARTIYLSGLITGAGFDPTLANFTLNFNQTNGTGNAFNYSGTLAVAVPEPASVVMMGMGLVGFAFVGRRRLGLRSKLAA